MMKQTPQTEPENTGGAISSVELSDLSPFLLNRELSLLEFFRRVLEEAEDKTEPILERLKFLSIFASNLDEFFMVRVSGLKETFDEGITELSPDGQTPEEQLKAIRQQTLALVEKQSRCLQEEILPELEREGVVVAPYASLSEMEQAMLNKYFTRRIFPVLTPQAVDAGHPFPYISGLSLNLWLMVGPVREHGITQSLTGLPTPRFTRIKIPQMVPRLVPV